MSIANIKIPSRALYEIKRYTGEKTGQKAVQRALVYFLKDARQRRILDTLKTVSFKKGFDPLKLRHHER